MKLDMFGRMAALIASIILFGFNIFVFIINNTSLMDKPQHRHGLDALSVILLLITAATFAVAVTGTTSDDN